MIKKLTVITILLLTVLVAQDLDSLLAILESHREDREWLDLLMGRTDYHIIYFKAGYESNSYAAGRDIGLDQFNAVLQSAYHFKGFTATAAGIIYPEMTPRWNITYLSGGYKLPLAFPLDIDLAYDRYFFHTTVDSLRGNYPNGFRVGLSFIKKTWGINANYTLLAGEESTSRVNMGAYAAMIPLRWKQVNSLRFQPRFDLIFGSEFVPAALFPGSDPTQDYTAAFGLINMSLTLPLTCYIGDWDLSLAFIHNRPRSLEPGITYEPSSLFAVSAGYVISIRQK